MAVCIPRGPTDPAVDEVARKLETYTAANPEAVVEVYRQNSVSIRVRVIDPSFQPLSRSERSRRVWPILRELPEETLSEISMVLLIPPEEKSSSMVSREFDDPIPSSI